MGSEQTKMLERVRALLAKADGTDFPEEAATFRAKADELMTKFSISQWQVKEAQGSRDARAVPERREFAMTWTGSRFRSDLLDLFVAVAEHCRCVAGWRGASYSNGEVPVYGLSSDLDYLELLFTTLNLEVAKNMDPGVDKDGEVGHEVYKQRQAGISWPRITEKMYKAGLVKLSKGERSKLDAAAERYASYYGDIELGERPDWDDIRKVDRDYGSDLGPVLTSMKNRLANANRRYVRENGLDAERNYVKPDVYQRSFMYGFRLEVKERIQDMSARSRRAYDEEHEAGSMALAVRDIKQQAVDLYESEFPPPPPVDLSGVKLRKGRKVATRTVRVDSGAIRQGRAAGAKADLSNNPGRRVSNPKKGLGR